MKQTRKLGMAFLLVSIAVMASGQRANSAPAGNGDEGQGRALVTVLPAHAEQTVNVSAQDIQQLQVNGKAAQVTGFEPARGAANPVELVFLIDGSARSSLGTQMNDITQFIQEMPPNTKMAIAYMENGVAAFQGPLSSDPAQVLQALHLPAGPPGISASPYFCLSDLAKHWPSHNRAARREVVMISDGVDYYERRYDPEDPYVHAAIDDSVRAGLVDYFIYWKNEGFADRFAWAQNTGQNLMQMVTQDTGGYSYWVGFGNPVDIKPYLQDLRRRLDNQYELGFSAPLGANSEFESMRLKLEVPNAKVDAPQEVWVHPAGRAAY